PGLALPVVAVARAAGLPPALVSSSARALLVLHSFPTRRSSDLGVHERWVAVLASLRAEDFARAWFHPERGKTFDLDFLLALYAWHGRHHVAHVTELRARRGW